MTGQKSQKGANDIVMKRKVYQQLLDWKEKRHGEVALLVEGARRIGKSYIVEEFGRNEYESYILIDFNKAPEMVREWFDLYLEDLDTLFLYFVRGQGPPSSSLWPMEGMTTSRRVRW